MFKNLFIIILLALTALLFTADEVKAQQDATYTQYMFQPLVFNPAYAGSRGNFSATAIYRRQWLDINNAPTSISLGVYHIPFNRGKLSLGIQGGILYFDDNREMAILDESGDPVFLEDVDGTSPNFGAGIYYYSDIHKPGIISLLPA